MTQGIDEEFKTVDLVLLSGASTMCVDAFCLTWIKFERQLRKLAANLLFQASDLLEDDEDSKSKLRAALARKSKLNHNRFIHGIEKLTATTARQIMGNDYKSLRRSIETAYTYRNKLFHGQQTGHNLNQEQLMLVQSDVRQWCEILAQEGFSRFGYDGFSRNSLHKTNRPEVVELVDHALTPSGWNDFIEKL